MASEFEWDDEKQASNLVKHKVDFEDAIAIWLSPTLEQPDLRQQYGEDRFITYGIVDGIVLAVVWTPRGDTIRIISARKANKHEREAYHAAVARPDPETG